MSANPISGSANRTTLGRPAKASLAARHGAVLADEVSELRPRRLGDAILHVSKTSEASFAFELRSRVNARMLVGGPIAYSGDMRAAIDALLARCRCESSFRIDGHAHGGTTIKLIDEDGGETGRSEPIANEAMAAVMVKLIATQARCARVVLES